MLFPNSPKKKSSTSRVDKPALPTPKPSGDRQSKPAAQTATAGDNELVVELTLVTTASVLGQRTVLDPAKFPAEAAAVYAGWAELVGRIRASQTDGMAELYHLFSKGVRFYLCRQLGIQELDDKVHDIFMVVVLAIRRGELREPERLMGFVRTVVRRQVAAHIDKVVQARREQMDLEASCRVPDPHGNPEEAAISRQREDWIRSVLGELSSRDREILTRFYLREETQEVICSEMILTETQFRLLKSRAKFRFGELAKRKLAQKSLSAVCLRSSAAGAH